MSGSWISNTHDVRAQALGLGEPATPSLRSGATALWLATIAGGEILGQARSEDCGQPRFATHPRFVASVGECTAPTEGESNAQADRSRPPRRSRAGGAIRA